MEIEWSKILPSLIVTTLFFLINFVFAWIRLGSDRFHMYDLYEEVEESIRYVLKRLEAFDHAVKNSTNDKQKVSYIKILSEDLSRSSFHHQFQSEHFYGLFNKLNWIRRQDVRSDDDCFTWSVNEINYRMNVEEIIDWARWADIEGKEILRACLVEKAAYEGWFWGNLKTLFTLFRRTPLNKQTIIKSCVPIYIR